MSIKIETSITIILTANSLFPDVLWYDNVIVFITKKFTGLSMGRKQKFDAAIT